MTTVFHAWPYSRFIEIQSNLRRKNRHRANQGSNFLGGTFSNRDNERAPIQFRTESQSHTIKDKFSSRTDPSILHQQHQCYYQIGQTKPVECLVDQTQKQFRSQFQLLPQIRCLITQSREQQQEKCKTINGALRDFSIIWIFL